MSNQKHDAIILKYGYYYLMLGQNAATRDQFQRQRLFPASEALLLSICLLLVLQSALRWVKAVKEELHWNETMTSHSSDQEYCINIQIILRWSNTVKILEPWMRLVSINIQHRAGDQETPNLGWCPLYFFVSRGELQDFSEDSFDRSFIHQPTQHNQINFAYHILSQTKFYFTSNVMYQG